MPRKAARRRRRSSTCRLLGRITQLAETGDGRYLVTLTGIARFRVTEELSVTTPYRQARVDL